MRGKQIWAGLTALLLAISLAACGSAEKKENKRISLIVKVPTLTVNSISRPDIADAQMLMELAAEKFKAKNDKVDIQVEVFDYVDENEAIVSCYGTPNAVDVLYEGYFNMAAYVSSGHVVSLDDIISPELRADISDASWAQSTKNGKTYMMPYFSMQNILIYNKELFRSCGLERFLGEGEVIQNWTLDEWETILDTLAAELPQGSYPMLMYSGNNQGDTHIMIFLRAFGSTIFDAQGDFDFESPEAIQALRWLQDGVDRGWYPPHPELLELNDCYQLFKKGQMGIYLFNNGHFTLYDEETIFQHYGFVNFPGNMASSFITGFEVFDNGDPDKVQAAKEFVQFIYEDEELLEISAGNIPESKRVAEKYADQIKMLPQFMENENNVVDFMNSSPNWQGTDTSVRSVFWPQIHELLAGRVTPEECAARLNQVCNDAIHVETAFHD